MYLIEVEWKADGEMASRLPNRVTILDDVRLENIEGCLVEQEWLVNEDLWLEPPNDITHTETFWNKLNKELC